MAMALTLKQYLDENYVPYTLESHAPTMTALATAHACAIAAEDLAKGVLARCRDGYILAIIPASHQLDLERLGSWIGAPVGLADEDELAGLFGDCETGCAPPVAAPYGLNAVVDTRLNDHSDVYFEAGDHRTVVHMSGHEFDRLCRDAPRVQIAS